MAIAFLMEAVAVTAMVLCRDDAWLFALLSGVVFFGWGEIFSLFPSTLTDTFGPKYAATNYGFLYIAQGIGSILGGPAAAFLKQSTGSWTAVFIIVAVLDIVTALLAITALRSMRAKHLQAS
jgi:MFS family permease